MENCNRCVRMSTQGRGRGYTGRHHLREPRPGDPDLAEELEAARTLAELSPRSTVSRVVAEPAREYNEPRDSEPRDEPERGDRSDRGDRGDLASDDAVLADLLTIDEQYAPLLALLEQFSPGEDGIQFNRKLRHFETTVTNMCPDETRLQQAFATFRAAALAHAGTARRLAAVGASFTRQQRQQLLRAALLNVVMQGTFSKLDVLERANPQHLINAANLMGDYFAEARLCNGNKVHILASPLLQYMKALLASDDIRAHRSLATQLMQNGRELLLVLAQELDELSISIRLRLLSPPPVSVVWLLLSADLCLNKFLPLPNTLQQFYAAHLELTTDENYSEVSYGSWKKPDEHKDDSDKIGQNISQISLNHSDDTKPKLRPILGAGAGLLRQEQSLSATQDNYDTWATRNSLSKRYDLNSWRQADEEKKEESEPVFNPNVLPPNYQVVPNYPPPGQYNYQENLANYLQQGDGTYIQNQYNNVNYSQQGDAFYQDRNVNERVVSQDRTGDRTQVAAAPFLSDRNSERTALPAADRAAIDRVNNELQKNSARRPVENWRKEKSDLKDDPNRNRQRNWTRQKSKDNVNEDEDKDRKSRDARPTRLTRRNSGDSLESSGKTPQRRNVTDVPRNHKYWDHDDRCDKDYNS
ncbi:uncharacterized protein LOC115453434 isoform X1 [Manduca sexta]|uniref:uncharacterized protein LOC115453434 isoform X1 n=2 Tax=Manduca sexta TaxID=7130 RepID=UPI00188E9F1B|nr:uncharacterized protein LOC115453434 isoform X1 [Manduca sexta]